MAQSHIRVTNRGNQDGGGVDVRVDSMLRLMDTEIFSDSFGTGQGGQIILQAELLTLGGRTHIRSDTLGAGQGGTIELAVANLTLDGGVEIRSNSPSRATGDAGRIIIHGRGRDGTAADSVTLNESTLQTNTDGEGKGGDISITANSVELTQANLTAETTGAGDAGDITLDVGRLNATKQTVIISNTAGSGNAGNIMLNVNHLNAIEQTLIASDSTDRGDDAGEAGKIVIQGLTETDAASSVTVTDSMLRTQTIEGDGGDLIVTANSVVLTNANLTAATTGAGDAGHIRLNIDDLNATGGTTITTSSRGAGTSGNLAINGSEGLRSEAKTVRLDNASIRNETFSTNPRRSGLIFVRAETLTLTNTATLNSNTFGAAPGGGMILQAGILTLDEQSSIQSETFGTGQGGTIELAVANLTLNGGAEIRSNSSRISAADAGRIIIHGRGRDGTAADSVTLNESTLQTNTAGAGKGGTISITANSVALAKANLTAETSGTGDAGDIIFHVDRLDAIEQTRIASNSTDTDTSAGNAGQIIIQGLTETDAASSVTVTDSMLLTGTIDGDGGAISVTANSVALAEAHLSAETAGVGDAGDIIFHVDRLDAIEQTRIASNSTDTDTSAGNAGQIIIQGLTETDAASSVTVTDSMLLTGTIDGDGGAISVTANSVVLAEAHLSAETSGDGDAGDIALNVDRLNATEQTLITSSSVETATGDAGSVTIQGLGGTGMTARIVVLNNSNVQTRAESDQASGGPIRVQAELIRLRDESAIRSDTNGEQRGGDIDLDANFVVLENSEVIANSETAQEKAVIDISGAFIADPRSIIQASGGVSILGSVFDLSGSVQLPVAFSRRTVLLSQRCVNGLRGDQVSSFALVGRDGLPLEPGRMLLSNLQMGEYSPGQEERRPQTQIGDMERLLPVAWKFDCDK